MLIILNQFIQLYPSLAVNLWFLLTRTHGFCEPKGIFAILWSDFEQEMYNRMIVVHKSSFVI
jgi:hypothetical protein